MSIASLPPFYNMQWSDKEGYLTGEAMMYSDELSQTLIQAITLLNLMSESAIINDGTVPRGTLRLNAVRVPNKTTAEITSLEPGADLGSIWFDTDVAKLKVKTAAGTVETITST
jgi:hypothetical protein